jgi:hypothetical protein
VVIRYTPHCQREGRLLKTYKFEDGKYEFDRSDDGTICDARRHGEHWSAGLDLFIYSKCFHAALNRIDELEQQLEDKQIDPR